MQWRSLGSAAAPRRRPAQYRGAPPFCDIDRLTLTQDQNVHGSLSVFHSPAGRHHKWRGASRHDLNQFGVRSLCSTHVADFASASGARKWLKTNTRIADDRLQMSRLRSIRSTSIGTVVCSWAAISRKQCQNSFSSYTLVFCPLRVMERLITADFFMCSSWCIKRPRPRIAYVRFMVYEKGLSSRPRGKVAS